MLRSDAAKVVEACRTSPPSRAILDPSGEPYMEMYRLGRGIRVHHILKSDGDRHMHDHPWNYRSEILDGSYVEFTPKGSAEFAAGDLLTRAARAPHRLVLEAPVWTLFSYGRFYRDWGFHTPSGWVPNALYRERGPRCLA